MFDVKNHTVAQDAYSRLVCGLARLMDTSQETQIDPELLTPAAIYTTFQRITPTDGWRDTEENVHARKVISVMIQTAINHVFFTYGTFTAVELDAWDEYQDMLRALNGEGDYGPGEIALLREFLDYADGVIWHA